MAEKKNKKHTTFEVGPISEPRMRDIMADAWRGAGREVLREELDIHSSFTWEKFQREGVDAHFNADMTPVGALSRSVSPSTYWTQDESSFPWKGYLTCPSTASIISPYSKRAFKYPMFSGWIVLPDLVGKPTNTRVWFGFENGGYCGNGLAVFNWWTPNGVTERLDAVLGGNFWKHNKTVDITNLLPAGYKNPAWPFGYQVEVTRPMAVFYIETKAVAYGLISPTATFTAIQGPPYALFSIEAPIARRLDAFLEIEVPGGGHEVKFQLPPFGFRLSDGDPIPPRVFRLYDAGTNTLFAGLVIAAGSETSHPVPVYGYAGKTIYFRANRNSTANGLVIEYLSSSGTWREFDAVTYTANDDWYYPIAPDLVLVRLAYTPAAYPATINEGEVILR